MSRLNKRIQDLEVKAGIGPDERPVFLICYTDKKQPDLVDGWSLAPGKEPLVTRLPGETCEALSDRAIEEAKKLKEDNGAILLMSYYLSKNKAEKDQILIPQTLS